MGGTFADPDQFFTTNEDGIEQAVTRELRQDMRRTRVWYGPIGSGEKLMKYARKKNEYGVKQNTEQFVWYLCDFWTFNIYLRSW